MLGGTDYKSKSSIFRKYRSGSDSIKVQANYCINTFPNEPWFLHVCRTSLSKTPWEKEKLFVCYKQFLVFPVFFLFFNPLLHKYSF